MGAELNNCLNLRSLLSRSASACSLRFISRTRLQIQNPSKAIKPKLMLRMR